MRGTFRQVTSRRESPSDGSAFDGVKKAHDLEPGTTLVLADLEGAGRIVRLWLTLPLLGQRDALHNVVLRMLWDGEAEPSVEVPLGEFFGAAFGAPKRVVSSFVVQEGGAFLSRFVMPFNTAARIELRNDGRRRVRQVFFQVGYLEEPVRDEPLPTLHAQFRRKRVAAGDPAVEVLTARGTGRLVGVNVAIENRSWWLKPPISHIVLPRGFGLGLLEGWETIIVDDDVEHALVGTGAEDYFLSGFYFAGAPFCTPTHGCTHRSFFSGRMAAYRFHEDDPVPFTTSLSFVFDHGLKNQMAGEYSSTAYWYQVEPHAAFPPLPDVEARQYSSAWVNPVQWLVVGILALTLVAVLAYAWAAAGQHGAAADLALPRFAQSGPGS